MTSAEGSGVRAMLALLEGIGRRHHREEVRAYVDGLSDVDLSDVMTAASAAEVAEGGTGNLLYESAAARLRGVDVETFGSAVQHQKGQGRRK